MINEVERIKASIRGQVEHPFRVITRQGGFVNATTPRMAIAGLTA